MVTERCPACRFEIPIRAAVCGHCRTDLDEYRAESKALLREYSRERAAARDHRDRLIFKNFPHQKTLIAAGVVCVLMGLSSISDPPANATEWLALPIGGLMFAYAPVYCWRWLMLKLRGEL